MAKKGDELKWSIFGFLCQGDIAFQGIEDSEVIYLALDCVVSATALASMRT